MPQFQTKAPFIGSSETLVVLAHLDGNALRVCEGDDIGTMYPCAAGVAAAFDDEGIAKFKRLYMEGDIIEDVTEEVAAAYIASHRLLVQSDEDTIPVYVQRSQAWSDHCNGETPSFDPVAEYGTYRAIAGRVA